MTLEQLRIFLAVAEQSHVTRAAEQLHLTQSSVSAAVAALEERYGVKLFNRVGRGIELTDAGRLFVPEARAVLEKAAEAARLLKDLSGAPSGHLSIHASQTVSSYWLPSRLMAYHERHPQVDVAMSVGNTKSVAGAVLAGRADLGVVEGRIDEPALAIKKVGEDRLVLVVGQRHRWRHGQGLLPAIFWKPAGSCETRGREPAPPWRKSFGGSVFRLQSFRWCWSCLPTRRSLRPWKRAQVPPCCRCVLWKHTWRRGDW